MTESATLTFQLSERPWVWLARLDVTCRYDNFSVATVTLSVLREILAISLLCLLAYIYNATCTLKVHTKKLMY